MRTADPIADFNRWDAENQRKADADAAQEKRLRDKFEREMDDPDELGRYICLYGAELSDDDMRLVGQRFDFMAGEGSRHGIVAALAECRLNTLNAAECKRLDSGPEVDCDE